MFEKLKMLLLSNTLPDFNKFWWKNSTSHTEYIWNLILSSNQIWKRDFWLWAVSKNLMCVRMMSQVIPGGQQEENHGVAYHVFKKNLKGSKWHWLVQFVTLTVLINRLVYESSHKYFRKYRLQQISFYNAHTLNLKWCWKWSKQRDKARME